jgi:signal transduction histidine kinase
MARSVILIVVDHKGNRDLLEKTLQHYYDMKVSNAEDSFDQSFDLGIFDGVSLNRLRKQLKTYREIKSTVFQPILLVSSRQDIGIVTGQLWQSIDEIIFTPIEKKELLARVEVLLRAHNYSVELKRLNAEVKENAIFEERRRLARELHDSVTQMIFSASTLAQTIPQLQKNDPERAKAQLEEVVQLNRSALSEIRTLLLELKPGNAIRMTLKDLVDQLIIGVQGHRNITISANVDELPTLPEDIHLGIYRIVQEALNNIAKHSHASEAHVSLMIKDGHLFLQIRDNGSGFDIEKQTPGFGLDGIGERAALMSAALNIASRIGSGTEITVSLPLPQELSARSQPSN